jgi:hypothetical protein
MPKAPSVMVRARSWKSFIRLGLGGGEDSDKLADVVKQVGAKFFK